MLKLKFLIVFTVGLVLAQPLQGQDGANNCCQRMLYSLLGALSGVRVAPDFTNQRDFYQKAGAQGYEDEMLAALVATGTRPGSVPSPKPPMPMPTVIDTVVDAAGRPKVE